MTEELLVDRNDGIVTATFNRPKARNALTYEMYDGLGVLLGEIDGDPEVKALILTGAGGEAFAAGTAIAQFESLRTREDSLAYEGRIETLLHALEHCRVPTIAALAGACTGGGAMIAACCDLRIASANLKFGFPIARTLGNCLSTQNLARLVALLGEPRVRTMIFTARLLGIDEALVAGLVSEVVEDADALAARADALAREVASLAPITLRSTKDALLRLRAPVEPANDIVGACYTSRDFREGVEAFVARRKPRWEGR
ncbi:Enoyl-CoA hydratase/carnithine racemase [Beijerinckiaceae bacterium RH AL1]|nr:enoyl-CoA hydratase [Beijerinckiaceae bacterium]VVB46431.1 Enoyl-CoA hydratase/carnithine racemase [Beijerinckiaceae bacterium RH CH11]VVB46516.1 Enoyl-CoA hydratase/carnithine racemase [Beijerinckiaceae bacterium RH AL8]VVC55371.1 Enoyl-CoA hydratase/carnithine racemase [Beijerinckiaceae bacterium RH AL1]